MKKFFTPLLFAIALHVNAQPCIPNTNAIQFDGSASYVSISPQTGLDITATITVEAWIKPAFFGFNSAQNSIVCKHGWSSGEGGFVLRCGGTGELSFNIAGIDMNQIPVSWVEVFSSTNVLLLNTWTHVAGTFDGTELKCYVNGNLEGTTTFSGTIAPSTAYPLALGRLADPVWGPDRYFSGSMDEVRVWNRALSQAELQAGMNNHIDPAGASGLVSYWRMNEGAGATVYDVAGTNNGGTVFCTWDASVPFNAVPETPIISYNGGILTSSAPIGNQWYLGGTPIGGATQNTFTPQQNGVYTVEVTSGQGCSAMSAQFTVVDVGIPDLSKAISLIHFPNPVHDLVTFNIVNSVNIGGESIVITDLQGRLVSETKNISLPAGTTTISIDVKQLSPGIYFYQLAGGGINSETGKLVVE